MNALVYAPGPFIDGRQLADSLQGTQVIKGPLALPQNVTSTLFTVTGGSVMVTALIGRVITTLGVASNTLAIGVAPTSGSANIAGLGNTLSISGLAAGTLVTIPFAVGAAGSNLVAPAIPLSGAKVTNNYHGTVEVIISGGTVSAVFINGVSVGLGGTYEVPAHATISMTYSVAPTWTWTSSSVLVANANGVLNLTREHIIPKGTITWTTTGNATGTMSWYLNYIQLDTQPGFNFGVVNL